MCADINTWCQECKTCAAHNVRQGIKSPLTPIPVAGPFDRVGVDFIKFPKSKKGYQYAIVFVDYLPKCPEVYATKDQSSLTKAHCEMLTCFRLMFPTKLPYRWHSH